MAQSTHVISPNVIGYSGRIGSGKDLAVKIHQYLTCTDEEIRNQFLANPVKAMADYDGIIHLNSPFVNVKYSAKVKLIVAQLLGVTVNKLEDKEYINAELPQNWWYYIVEGEKISYDNGGVNDEERVNIEEFLVRLTPRKMMQLVGTEGGRDVIHPDVWVNATFADYVKDEDGELPSWVISDVRFQNEKNKVIDVGGAVIRLIRTKLLSEWLETYSVKLTLGVDYEDRKLSDHQFMNFMTEFYDSESNHEVVEKVTHASETSLDNETFDYYINNDSTIENMVNEIYGILLELGVISEFKEVAV